MIYVMICDDHQLMQDGIELMLDAHEQIALIAKCSNGQEAIDYISENKIDVVLLDINMPVMNGIETCKHLQKHHPDVKVVGLSMVSDVELIQAMINLGAKGYLLKNSGQDEVIQTILDVHSGKEVFDTRILSDILHNKKNAKTNTSFVPHLSRREKEVLSLIVDEFTTKEIAEKLFISFGTVETHRRNMISKLGVRNTAGLVRAVYEYDLLKNDTLGG